jgi:hypothetical protein
MYTGVGARRACILRTLPERTNGNHFGRSIALVSAAVDGLVDKRPKRERSKPPHTRKRDYGA